MPTASDYPGQFFPRGWTGSNGTYGVVEAKSQAGGAHNVVEVPFNQWYDRANKTVYYDNPDHWPNPFRDVKWNPDIVGPGWKLINVMDSTTTPSTVPTVTTIQGLANQLFNVAGNLQTTLTGINQAATSAANTAQTTQATVAAQNSSSSGGNNQTLVIVGIAALAALFFLSKK